MTSSNTSSRASSRQRRTSFILEDEERQAQQQQQQQQAQLPALGRTSSTISADSSKLPALGASAASARIVAAAYRNEMAQTMPTTTATGSAPNTPQDTSLLAGSNDSSSSSLFGSSALAAAGSLDLLESSNNGANNNSSSSAFRVVPNAANVLAVRRLMEERCQTHRLQKKVKSTRRHFRERLEAMERERMCAEDLWSQMSVRNILWVDGMKDCASPSKAVRGIAPGAAGAAASGSSSRRGSGSLDEDRKGGVDHSYHFRHSGRRASSNGAGGHHHSHGHHHHHIAHLHQHLAQRNVRRASSSSAASSGAAGTAGAVSFAGIRRFGFAAAALPNLAERENMQHAQDILALRSLGNVQPQSLAPEAHALLCSKNSVGVGPVLRDFHDETVDAVNEYKRFSDDTVDALAFIFEEAQMPIVQSGRGILRDPREDFVRELHLFAEHTRNVLQAQLTRCNDAVLRALRAAGPQKQNASSSAASAATDEASSAATPMRPSPFAMAAATVGFENRVAPHCRSVGVQVGSTREEELQRELDEVRAQFRALQRDSIQREKDAEAERARLAAEVDRLTGRTQLLHQCLRFQKEGTAAAIGKAALLEQEMIAAEQQQVQLQMQMQQSMAGNTANNSTATSNNVSASASANASRAASPDFKESTGSFSEQEAAALAAGIIQPRTPPPVTAASAASSQADAQQQPLLGQHKPAGNPPPAVAGRAFREKALCGGNATSAAASASSGRVTPREESSAASFQQQQQQHASTPQVEPLGAFRFPQDNGLPQQQQQLPAKPRSASRRLTMTVGVNDNNSAAASAAAVGGGKVDSARGKENAAAAKSTGTNIPNGAAAKKTTSAVAEQAQQQQQSFAKEPTTVCVSSSLKRMESWQQAQTQLWERRRSQLERHTAFEGMLKLSRSSSTASSSDASAAAAATGDTSARALAAAASTRTAAVGAVAVSTTTYAPLHPLVSVPSVPSGNQPFYSSVVAGGVPGAKRK